MEFIDSYKRLSIGKYIEILRVNRDENLEEVDKQVKTLAILADEPEEDILNRPIADFKILSGKAKFLEKTCEDISLRIGKEYRIGEWSLCPVTDHRKINTAQYIDFQEYAKNGDESLVEVLSCLMIPKGSKYNEGYDIIEVQKAIRENLSVYDVLCLSAFFLASFLQLIADSLIYSRGVAEKITEKTRRQTLLQMIQEQKTLLELVGGGLQMLMKSRKLAGVSGIKYGISR